MLNEDQIRAVYAEHVKLITDRTRKKPKLWEADTVNDTLSLGRMEDLLHASLAALLDAGYVVIPVKATARMITAWEDASPSMDDYHSGHGHWTASYRAMLEAAVGVAP